MAINSLASEGQSYIELIKKLNTFKEVLISNLIIVAEKPAEVGNTRERARCIVERLSETENLGAVLDKVGNVTAEFLSEHSRRNIVLHAHIDTHHSKEMDHSLQVFSNKIIGLGLADNSLGIAVLMTLPTILRTLQIQLQSNLIFCFSANSLDAGDLKGTQYFLDNYTQNIQYGICVEGFPLGRVSYSSLGLLRGEIDYAMPKKYDWTRFETSNSIVNMVNIINRILSIPLPNKPRTSIQFTKLHSGTSYDVLPRSAKLQFQVRSESNEIVEKIKNEIESILSELALGTGATAEMRIIAKRRTGGLPFSHPLISQLREIQKTLKVPSILMPSTSDLCAFIDKGIPAITVGLTECEGYNYENEVIYIDPIFVGIAQLLGLILEIDKGLNNG